MKHDHQHSPASTLNPFKPGLVQVDQDPVDVPRTRRELLQGRPLRTNKVQGHPGYRIDRMKGSGFRVGLRVLPPIAVGCGSCSDLSAAHGAGMFEVAAVYLNGEQQTTMWSFPKLFVFFGGPHNKDDNILGSRLGSIFFGKLPCD